MVNKGVDLVGWPTCPRQKEWGPKRFALTLKKIGRQAAEVATMPPPPANPAALTMDQRKRLQLQQEMRQNAAIFNQGTPECRDCTISAGRPFGCYVFVDYPIDAQAERALFDYFSKHVAEESSACAGIYRDLVAKLPSKGTIWHTDRGPAGSLAELDQPLVKEWGFVLWKKRLDSAQILGSLFFQQTRVGLISIFAKFWEDFIEEAQQNPDFEGSKTLKQLEQVSEFYTRVGAAASVTENVFVIVEDDVPSLHKQETAAAG